MDSPYRQQLDKMKWSYSRLHCYETCPASFKRLYLDHCNKSENAFAQFGSLCHSILEDYENGKLVEYELADEYNNRWNEYVTEDFPPSRWGSMGDKYYGKGSDYFAEFDGFPENWEIIGAEIDAEFDLDDIHVVGFLDLLVRDKSDGKLIVVDHKSKAGFKTEAEKREYAIQLYLYSVWVYNTYHEYPKELKFNMFREKEIVTIPFNHDDYLSAIQWAHDIVGRIYSDVDFWDKIELQYEKAGKEISEFNHNDFFCNNLCSCRRECGKSAEGVQNGYI